MKISAGHVRPVSPARPGAAPLSLLLAAAALALCLASPEARAQYKVVQPDGSTTYTDRPPVDNKARITSLNRRGTKIAPDAAESNSGLPLDLRQAAQRYPVTLYSGNECAACEAGRRFLQARGIPFAEKRVSTEEDAQALEKLAGARAVPALTIGSQPLRGFAEGDWTSYLDAAGYPKESKLPRGWQAQAAQPLVERSPPARPEPKAEAPAVVPPAPPAAASGPRF